MDLNLFAWRYCDQLSSAQSNTSILSQSCIIPEWGPYGKTQMFWRKFAPQVKNSKTTTNQQQQNKQKSVFRFETGGQNLILSNEDPFSDDACMHTKHVETLSVKTNSFRINCKCNSRFIPWKSSPVLTWLTNWLF